MARDQSDSPSLRLVAAGVFSETDIASAFSDLGSAEAGGKLKLRSDLETREGAKGRISVRKPESPTWFDLYAFEWRIARLFDGKRGLPEITAEIARAGIGANTQLIASFARELRGYGFLAEGAEPSDLSEAPEREAETSSELRHLIDAALALQAKGDLRGASNYLTAVLEIQPSHHMVRQLLRRIQKEMAASAPAEDDATDLDVALDTGEALRHASAEVKGFLEMAMGLQARGDYEQACGYLEAALEMEPTSTSVRDLLRHLQWKALAVKESAGSAAIGPASGLVSAPSPPASDVSEVSGPVPGAAPNTPSRTPWVVYFFGVAGLGAAAVMGVWFWPTPPPPVVVTPEPVVEQSNEFRAPARLQSSERENVESPGGGAVATIRVAESDMVEAGAELVALMPRGQFTRLARLKKKYSRFAKRAILDTVYRFQLPDLEKKIGQIEKKAQVVRVVAPYAARVARILVSVGDHIEPGAPVIAIENVAVLVVQMPLTSLPEAYEEAQCTIRVADMPAVPCRLKAGDADDGEKLTARFMIDNSANQLQPDQWAELVLDLPHRPTVRGAQ